VAERLGAGARSSPAYDRALAVAREILGGDLAFDFDMLIDKARARPRRRPGTRTLAYWIDLPDRRAASCWIALDEATVDNGCLWFVPGSHRLPMRPHRSAGRGGGALECDGASRGVAVPLPPARARSTTGGRCTTAAATPRAAAAAP